MQEKRAVDDISRILSRYSMQENGDKEYSETTVPEEDDLETIHVYIYREEPKQNTIVDADRPKEKTHSFGLVIACFIFSLFPIFSIAFQIFVFLNPPTAIITIMPIQKELITKADMQLVPTNPGSNEILGHLSQPVSVSMSKVAPTTGRGHQNATFAQGTIKIAIHTALGHAYLPKYICL